MGQTLTEPTTRAAIQSAKAQNMPKDNIERAIKKASGAGGEDYKETTFEGYGPDGIAVFVECATDNTNCTVKCQNALQQEQRGPRQRRLFQFVFDRKSVFVLKLDDVADVDCDTFELIDWQRTRTLRDVYGICRKGRLNSALFKLSYKSSSGFIAAKFQRVPNMMKALGRTTSRVSEAHRWLQDDDDVQKVYHNAEIDEALLEQYL